MTSTATERFAWLSDSDGERELGAGDCLHVERTDIDFASHRPDLVEFSVTVCNQGFQISKPTDALLAVAPLGAFVPWRPLAVTAIPALQPGESFGIETAAVRPDRQPLGTPDSVTPRRLLTALGADDDQPQDDIGPMSWLRHMVRSGSAIALGQTVLPADPLELLSRPNAHWAGNLNVFIGNQDVERHMAKALRIYPGRVNTAMFMVGSGKDAYQFHLEGEGADWEAAVYDATHMRSLRLDPQSAEPLADGDWLEVNGTGMMVLALCPPENCKQGNVDVYVTQRSTGREAVVEFSLGANAAGPGCYVV